jgi:hypothetical protein
MFIVPFDATHGMCNTQINLLLPLHVSTIISVIIRWLQSDALLSCKPIYLYEPIFTILYVKLLNCTILKLIKILNC